MALHLDRVADRQVADRTVQYQGAAISNQHLPRAATQGAAVFHDQNRVSRHRGATGVIVGSADLIGCATRVSDRTRSTNLPRDIQSAGAGKGEGALILESRGRQVTRNARPNHQTTRWTDRDAAVESIAARQCLGAGPCEVQGGGATQYPVEGPGAGHGQGEGVGPQ